MDDYQHVERNNDEHPDQFAHAHSDSDHLHQDFNGYGDEYVPRHRLFDADRRSFLDEDFHLHLDGGRDFHRNPDFHANPDADENLVHYAHGGG